MFQANSNLIKLEILEMFGQKLGELVSKLKLKLTKWKIIEIDVCSNLKFWSSMKLEFDEKYLSSFKHYLKESKIGKTITTFCDLILKLISKKCCKNFPDTKNMVKSFSKEKIIFIQVLVLR